MKCTCSVQSGWCNTSTPALWYRTSPRKYEVNRKLVTCLFCVARRSHVYIHKQRTQRIFKDAWIWWRRIWRRWWIRRQRGRGMHEDIHNHWNEYHSISYRIDKEALLRHDMLFRSSLSLMGFGNGDICRYDHHRWWSKQKNICSAESQKGLQIVDEFFKSLFSCLG